MKPDALRMIPPEDACFWTEANRNVLLLARSGGRGPRRRREATSRAGRAAVALTAARSEADAGAADLFGAVGRRRLSASAAGLRGELDMLGSRAFTARRLTPALGARIDGVDLAGDMTGQMFDALYDAFLAYQVLVFPPQQVPPASQVSLARRFGEVQIHVMNQYHADGHPELYRLSNLDAEGKPNGRHPDKGTMAWHTDGSWRRRAGQATIIYGEVMPDDGEGGETHFCDMYGAYERLDDG